MAAKRLLPKNIWKHAIGANEKARRLKFIKDNDGYFYCPVSSCDSFSFKSQRGCRKHVTLKHGWYFYFDEKPDIAEALPSELVQKSAIQKTHRSQTNLMSMFSKTCTLFKLFSQWLMSLGGGSKSKSQADQIASRVLKFLKFCCHDACETWDIPMEVVDYCVGSIQSLSDYINDLEKQWKIGYSGIIGHINALSHLLDYRRIDGNLKAYSQSFLPAEIYLQRVKKTLAKKMRSEWHVVLSIEYLSNINCWASLADLQKVIPFHGDRFSQILINASLQENVIPPHDLSFCTSFVVVVLFLLVKASRPMTYQFLTVEMINNVDSKGMIDQTTFKTQEKYGFDTLIFSKDVIDIVIGYVKCIRQRLQPRCDFLLITRSGNQLTRLGDIFGRLVYQAIGKYVHPTRYRQIVETESEERLNAEDQMYISEDQKHTSNVAKVHYKKSHSRIVAEKGRIAMDKLCDNAPSLSKLKQINGVNNQQTETVTVPTNGLEKACPEERKRKKKIPFSPQEDNFILEGIKRYGMGKWKSILNDPQFSFSPTRTTATLMIRAKHRKFI